MSGELPLDDAPAPFAEEVRFAVSGPPPVPSPALASVLRAGFSNPTDKGDLLVTAGSNVHGPAPQAAGLPNWKEERHMGASGVLAGLLAKLSGVSGAAKAALAGVTALTTMGLAGGAAGVLPGPAQNVVASAVNATTPFQFPTGTDVAGTVEHAVSNLPTGNLPTGVTVPTVPPVTATATAKAGSTGASASASTPSANAGTSTAGVTPSIPNVSIPALPPVSIPTAVLNNLPACVKNLIPTAGSVPDPTKLASQIQACIPQILSTSNLPPQVATCVSSILGSIGGAAGMSPGSVPNVGSLNVSSCAPLDATQCVSSMTSFLANLRSLSGGGMPNVGNLSSLPGLTNLAGCVPMDVTKCLTSITSALSTGALSGGSVPKLDLSACMPTTLPTGTIPGLGSFSNLPGLTGALSFFGGR